MDRFHLRNDLRPQIRKQIQCNPHDGNLYYKLALEYLRLNYPILSIALFHTAMTFGYSEPEISFGLGSAYLKLGLFDCAQNHLSKIRDSHESLVIEKFTRQCITEHGDLRKNIFKPEMLGYGKYQRLRMISEKLAPLKNSSLYIADIGGGQGELILFLPEHHYALFEPSITGIGLPNLPFEKKSFDIVVCADVLEHVPKELRESMIAEMIRIASKRVYITSPFGEKNREMEQFFYELTQNHWTREHLEHEYTTLEEMKSFLEKRSIHYTIFPCSFLPVHFTMGYLNNHFLKNNEKLLIKVNEFFNIHYSDITRQEPSYGYLFELLLTE